MDDTGSTKTTAGGYQGNLSEVSKLVGAKLDRGKEAASGLDDSVWEFLYDGRRHEAQSFPEVEERLFEALHSDTSEESGQDRGSIDEAVEQSIKHLVDTPEYRAFMKPCESYRKTNGNSEPILVITEGDSTQSPKLEFVMYHDLNPKMRVHEPFEDWTKSVGTGSKSKDRLRVWLETDPDVKDRKGFSIATNGKKSGSVTNLSPGTELDIYRFGWIDPATCSATLTPIATTASSTPTADEVSQDPNLLTSASDRYARYSKAVLVTALPLTYGEELTAKPLKIVPPAGSQSTDDES